MAILVHKKLKTINTDIIIVGAGLVGIAAAVSLATKSDGKTYRIVLVDQKSPNTALTDIDSPNQWDSRIYAITPSSVNWFKGLGVWQLMDVSRITAINAMHIYGDVYHQTSNSQLQLNASDANVQSLGFIVENQQLMHALWQQLQGLDVEVITGVACESLSITAQKATLTLVNQQEINAELVVAADGVDSWVRIQANIAVKNKSYQQMAIVANFSCENSHQGIARQWFGSVSSGADSILAFLPLPNNHISIVWSVATEKAQQLLNLNGDDFIKQVSLLSGNTLGALKLVTARLNFPLHQQSCARLISERVVLVGDAAHQVHPLAGQGVNLGFRDDMALEQVLMKSKSLYNLASNRNLREYERARSADIMNMVQLTDGLNQLFAAENGVIKKMRNWGLSKINQQLFIKKMLIQQAIH